MTDQVTPSIDGDSDPYKVAQIIKFAGANDPGFVVPSDTDALATYDSAIANGPLNAFAETHSGTSYDVTIDTGEAFVEGAWVARDVTTTVTLAASTANQTVYLGWDVSATDTVIIGLSGAFAADDPKYPIWEFDTDGSGVTAARDQRNIGFAIREQIAAADNSTIGLFGMLASASSYAGTLGGSQDELFRAPGDASDLLMSVDDGSGAMNLAYNCYFDGDWRYILGTTPAYRLEFGGGETRLHAAPGGTADAIITFETAAVTNGGAFTLGTNTVHDGTEVPQGELGGPAASLTSYPLPPGDIDDGSGSGLDADMVDGKHASEIGGAGGWNLINTYIDNDDTTGFDIDTGTLATTYDQYRFTVYTEVKDGGENAPAYVNTRLNNDSQSVYDYSWIEGDTGVNNAGNETHFRYTPHAFGEKAMAGQFVVHAPGDDTTDGDGQLDQLNAYYIHIGANWVATDPVWRDLHNGQYENASANGVNRFRWWVVSNATNEATVTGRVVLEGKDFF